MASWLRPTNRHLLSPKQTAALKSQIQNCLLTYSRGDFDQFVKFRMPCGKGVNVTFNQNEVKKYVDNYLPTVEKMRQNFHQIPSEHQAAFEGYSLDSEIKVWKYMWIMAGQMKYEVSGGRAFCNDCWLGFSPEQSWVSLSELPVSATQLAKEAGHLEFSRDPSDLELAPPRRNRDSTPKLYAAVCLHANVDSKYGPRPVYVVFVLTTKPEDWVPIGLSDGYYRGMDYIF
ncbi:MAG: hypothetical protein M2R45_00874 [Verrucomicrobia subdivision 3 bacterium]|nr:hypothetical protein [Limisphaerales bacterium]